MNLSGFPGRWLVVDDSKEDAKDLIRAVEDLGGRADWAPDLKAAEELLRTRVYEMVVLDYIFRNSGRTGEQLLPSLRRALPHLPVIMVSSSDAPDLPFKALSAGADVFLPKTSQGLALARQLLGAARSAMASRTLRQARESSPLGTGRLHLWREAVHFLEKASHRRNGRFLIVGPRGGGRTSLALRAARDYLQAQFKDAKRPIVLVDCRSTDPEQLEAEILGEGDRVSSRVQLSAFERALGGVLLLDNVDAISAPLQRRMKAYFESLDLGLGGSFDADAAKVFATVEAGEIDALEPGFLESLAHSEVYIPALNEMPNLEGLLDLLLEVEGVVADADAREALLTALTIPAFAPSLRGAKRSIALATAYCRADGRDRLFRVDVTMAFARRASGDRSGEVLAASSAEASKDSQSGGAPCLSLASLSEMAKSGNVRFDTAKDLLKEILIENAMKRFGGNKKRVAEVLGISRQTIYEILEG